MLLLKLGVREVGETQCLPQRVLDPWFPAWKLVAIPSLKSHFILLCPDQILVPSEIKPFSLFFEMLLLQSRQTAHVGPSLGALAEAPGMQKMGINNIFLAWVREH